MWLGIPIAKSLFFNVPKFQKQRKEELRDNH